VSARFHSNLGKQNRSVADIAHTHPAHPLAHPTANRIASSETMNSAALRSRTTKHGGEDGDDTAGPAPVLDTDAQEALVLELERDARRQATIWRRVFGALSIAWGVYFLDCAAHAASGDVTRAWSGVRRPRTPHERPSHHDPSTSAPHHHLRPARHHPSRANHPDAPHNPTHRRYTRSFTTTIHPRCPRTYWRCWTFSRHSRASAPASPRSTRRRPLGPDWRWATTTACRRFPGGRDACGHWRSCLRLRLARARVSGGRGPCDGRTRCIAVTRRKAGGAGGTTLTFTGCRGYRSRRCWRRGCAGTCTRV